VLLLQVQPATDPYQQAVAYLQAGKPAAALQLLNPLLQSQPNDLKARTLMGMALTASGRAQEANAHYQHVLRINPRYAPALRNLGLNEVAAGQFAQARGHLEQALKLTPRDPFVHLALAETFVATRDFERALSHYAQSGELYLKDPRNLLNFARAAVAARQSENALRALRQMHPAAEPGDHFQAGVLLAELKDYESAARQFELAPGHPDPYTAGFNLALAYHRAGRHADAISAIERLIAAGYRKAELYNLRARAYENAGRIKEAYDSFRIATQIDPADETSYVDLIALCLAHKNLDLALEIAEIGVSRLPQSVRLNLQRGIVFTMKGEYPEALKAFQSTFSLAPGHPLVSVSLGLVLMQTDRVPDAIQVLRKRAQAAPNDYLVNWFLAEALNRSGADPGSAEENEAVEALQRSVRANPDLGQAHALLGKMLFRRGDLDRAGVQLERALTLEPDNTAAIYQLAQVYARKGDTTRAKELFAKVSKAKAEDREQFTRRGLQQIVREGPR
jgi:tetratricopeptide (TPR) repeat protein